MKTNPLRRWKFLLAGALAACLRGAALPAQTVPVEQLADGNTAFATALYQRLDQTPGNLFFSPYSISTCLAMTGAGARGATAAQMAVVLHLPLELPATHDGFGALQRELNDRAGEGGLQLDIANGLWIQQNHDFLKNFLQTAARDYRASVQPADFTTAAGPVTDEINAWVSKQTHGKIEGILPPGSVTADTRLVLANAIYFKGRWADTFKKSELRTRPFHTAPGKQTETVFMKHKAFMEYTDTADFQAVLIPYRGEALGMLILLPHDRAGLPRLEQQLNPELWQTLRERMTPQDVILTIPKFKLESGFDLKPTLTDLGMSDAFSPSRADFSGIDGHTGNLYISCIYHKAYIDVNEEGTEAAAATGMGMIAASLEMNRPPEFTADHPFIFAIQDRRTGSLLFLGRMAEPTR